MTIDEIIKAFLDGGITLGMLALFAFVIIRLPLLIREAVQTATAPMEKVMQSLVENLQHTQEELERLSIITYTHAAAQAPRKAASSAAGNGNANAATHDESTARVDATLRSLGIDPPGDRR